jgi:hypothetical protein
VRRLKFRPLAVSHFIFPAAYAPLEAGKRAAAYVLQRVLCYSASPLYAEHFPLLSDLGAYLLVRLPERRLVDLRADVFLLEELRRLVVLRDELLRGTRAPDFLASERPIAIACFRLVTLRPERPLFNVPRLRSCIAFSTFLDAPLLYFGMVIAPFMRSLYSKGGATVSRRRLPCQRFGSLTACFPSPCPHGSQEPDSSL